MPNVIPIKQCRLQHKNQTHSIPNENEENDYKTNQRQSRITTTTTAKKYPRLREKKCSVLKIIIKMRLSTYSVPFPFRLCSPWTIEKWAGYVYALKERNTNTNPRDLSCSRCVNSKNEKAAFIEISGGCTAKYSPYIWIKATLLWRCRPFNEKHICLQQHSPILLLPIRCIRSSFTL